MYRGSARRRIITESMASSASDVTRFDASTQNRTPPHSPRSDETSPFNSDFDRLNNFPPMVFDNPETWCSALKERLRPVRRVLPLYIDITLSTVSLAIPLYLAHSEFSVFVFWLLNLLGPCGGWSTSFFSFSALDNWRAVLRQLDSNGQLQREARWWFRTGSRLHSV